MYGVRAHICIVNVEKNMLEYIREYMEREYSGDEFVFCCCNNIRFEHIAMADTTYDERQLSNTMFSTEADKEKK